MDLAPFGVLFIVFITAMVLIFTDTGE